MAELYYVAHSSIIAFNVLAVSNKAKDQKIGSDTLRWWALSQHIQTSVEFILGVKLSFELMRLYNLIHHFRLLLMVPLMVGTTQIRPHLALFF